MHRPPPDPRDTKFLVYVETAPGWMRLDSYQDVDPLLPTRDPLAVVRLWVADLCARSHWPLFVAVYRTTWPAMGYQVPPSAFVPDTATSVALGQRYGRPILCGLHDVPPERT